MWSEVQIFKKTIARLRIDMNTLNDCQYRHNKKTVNKCSFCYNDSVEDVEHFLIDCCKFNNLRQYFFIRLSDFIPMFNNFSFWTCAYQLCLFNQPTYY